MAKGSKLVIVESPTKAKKIGGYLGDDYTVLASVGHIRDLAQPSQIPAADKADYGKFGVNVNDGFKPYYIVGDDKKKTVRELKSALKNADEVFLATDEDREGEAIAWHLVETLKPKVPVKRMVFHEITKSAITDSLNHTRDVDAQMVDAQETRRVVDRLYGYELSPVLWRKVGPGLSAGRVQSVATRLIVERERERMAFIKSAYWDLNAQLAADSSDAFTARLISLDDVRVAGSKDFTDRGELTEAAEKDGVIVIDEATAQALSKALQEADFVVENVGTKPYTRNPLPPFTTSTMQQAAGNSLGMSSRATMRAAQGLYENGYITYMRTDSVTLSQEAISAARKSVTEQWGEQYLSEKPRQFATKTAGAQEAHEAIRPAGSSFRNPADLASSLPTDQLKLYTLIWRRTLASQMAPATGSTATVRLSADAADQGVATFQASGTVIEFPGFLKAMGSSKGSSKESREDNNTILPPLSEGDMLNALKVEPVSHETLPPARYTEASLVRTLEAKEIGRPSTYASIISTIIDRGYVYERGRALIPSWLAFAVIKLLEQNFPQYVDYAFTAEMENGLDNIAQGKETGRQWLTRFYFGLSDDSAQTAEDVHKGLHSLVDQLGEIDAREINTIEIGDGLAVRVGRYGPYLEDSRNVDAEGKPKRASLPDTLAPDELTVEEGHKLIENNSSGPRVLGTHPVTGGTVEVRNGRFGPYVALVSPTQEGEETASTEKPKMASLFKTMTPQAITLEDAVRLLDLPRVVGTVEETNAETGESQQVEILANNGRYGPYLTKNSAEGKPETRSLGSEEEIFTVTLEQAKELFAQPKYGRRTRGAAKPPLRELGADPETGKNVTIKDGFYGVYITDGETNRTLPKQYTAESIEPAEAFRLLAEKRAAGPVKRRRSAKSTAKKTTAKKTTAKKSTTKKTTAKKTATKKAATKSTAKSSTKSATSAQLKE
ncbi:type I DNA topoisomerase [Alloscardovia criceti]|uniref:type I DNA topoisomerase n=1 Tax=Alloscardovia criceti TaxID=356828 RepID=UPI000370F9EA|nr:type I DNA topoisomerase [Alloscardovia criceti]